MVFDIDGTRQAARQRALPKTEELPPPQRRLTQVCAPGYTGRKRGEVVRTRTVVSQAHSYQWLGSFGNSGNGLYREELRRTLTAIRDESSGTPSFPFVCPAAMGWAVWDGGSHHGSGRFPLRDARQRLHRLGSTRDPEPFASPYRRAVQSLGKRPGATDLRLPRCRCGARGRTLPHRGAFEPVRASEDQEQDPDRWCSHTPAGQEAWQIVSQCPRIAQRDEDAW